MMLKLYVLAYGFLYVVSGVNCITCAKDFGRFGSCLNCVLVLIVYLIEKE